MSKQELIQSFALRSSYAKFGTLPMALAVLLVGCDAQNIDRRAPSSVGSSLNSETQVITQTDSNNQRVAQVSVPSGALAANQQLSIEPGFHTDTAEIHSEFNIGTDNTITPAGVATVVSSNIDSNLSTPMTIALDLPVSGAGLLGLFVDRHFFVVYTVRDSIAKAWKRGIVPNDSITIADNKLTFTTKLMGKYEVFQASKRIDPPKTERIVSEPELVAPPVSVSKVTPLAAKPDELVTLRGKYFTDKTTVSIGNLKVGTVKVQSSNQLTFHMPDIFGLRTITVAEATSTATAEVIGRSTRIDRPVIGLNPDQVCSGISYYDHQGNAQEGTRRCDYEACEEDGGTDCVASTAYPAVQKTKLVSDNLREGVTIAGVSGNVTKYEDCKEDAETGCVTTEAFKAANMANVQNFNIKSGVTIAGVAGFVQNYEDCTSDGDIGCVANTAFKAAKVANIISADLKNGKTIAGVNGTLRNCSVDGDVDCFLTPSFKAADPYAITANDLKSGKVIAGVAGTLANCATDNGTNCIATAAYPSVEKATVTAGVIRIGTRIAGVDGDFPSANHRLSGYQENTDQLTSGSIGAKVASSAVFQFWDAAGTLQTAQGTDSLKPENIRKGVEIFSATGAIKTDCRNALKSGTNEENGLGAHYYTIQDDGLPDGQAFDAKHLCKEDVWVDETIVSNVKQACTTISTNCMWQDTITQTYWAGDSKTSGRSWAGAANHCKNLTASNKSDWRLPTQKELMTAYTHGAVWIAGTNENLKGNKRKYWSATGDSNTDSNAFAVDLRSGLVESQTRGNEWGTVCVHD